MFFFFFVFCFCFYVYVSGFHFCFLFCFEFQCVFNLFLAYLFLFYFCGFCSIKLFFISYLPHNLIVQCFTHARLGLRECQVVSVVCEVYCVLCSWELNYYLVSSCFSLVYLRPIFHPVTVVSEVISPFLYSIPPDCRSCNTYKDPVHPNCFLTAYICNFLIHF